MRISDPIPVADATRVEVLADGVHYSDILQAALSAKTGATVADLVEQINAFYDCGYAFVKVLPDPVAVGDRVIHCDGGTGVVTAVDGDHTKVRLDGAQVEWDIPAVDLRPEAAD